MLPTTTFSSAITSRMSLPEPHFVFPHVLGKALCLVLLAPARMRREFTCPLYRVLGQSCKLSGLCIFSPPPLPPHCSPLLPTCSAPCGGCITCSDTVSAGLGMCISPSGFFISALQGVYPWIQYCQLYIQCGRLELNTGRCRGCPSKPRGV
jgi:hypothetical protein